jgi:hypothetical protein
MLQEFRSARVGDGADTDSDSPNGCNRAGFRLNFDGHVDSHVRGLGRFLAVDQGQDLAISNSDVTS